MSKAHGSKCKISGSSLSIRSGQLPFSSMVSEESCNCVASSASRIFTNIHDQPFSMMIRKGILVGLLISLCLIQSGFFRVKLILVAIFIHKGR
ncbi:hypothetical protein LMCDFJHI_02528 [Aeromonas salmonicida]